MPCPSLPSPRADQGLGCQPMATNSLLPTGALVTRRACFSQWKEKLQTQVQEVGQQQVLWQQHMVLQEHIRGSFSK